jgi:DNA primase
VFPAFDAAGNMTYVQARYLDPDAVGRKYDNPSAALAPHPRLSYPIAVSDRPTLIVCEGIPDALTATQAGYPAVAMLGAQTPDDAVATRIANHATNHSLAVVVVCDPDPAGRLVADTVVPLLARHGVNAAGVTPPHGCDLNDWALIDPDWPQQLDQLPDIDGPVVGSIDAGVELT